MNLGAIRHRHVRQGHRDSKPAAEPVVVVAGQTGPKASLRANSLANGVEQCGNGLRSHPRFNLLRRGQDLGWVARTDCLQWEPLAMTAQADYKAVEYRLH